MPRYLCRIGTQDRRIEVRELRAPGVEAIAARLDAAGQYLLEARRILPWEDLWTASVPRDEVALALGQVATLGRAGIGLEAAMRAVAESASAPRLQAGWKNVANAVSSGIPVARAFEAEPDLFDAILIGGIAAAASPESVFLALDRRAASLLEAEEFGRKVRSALAYPAFLLGMSGLVLSYLVGYVVPAISQLFVESHTRLPALTRATRAVVNAIHARAPVLLAATIALAAALAWARTTDAGETAIEATIAKIPGLGTSWQALPWTRWALTLSDALGSSLPLPAALRMAASVVARERLARKLENVAVLVERGKTVPEAMRESRVAGPPLIAGCLSLPLNEAGLSEALRGSARAEAARISWALTRFSRTIEPILVLAVGVVIAVLVISLYLPILSLAETL